MSTQGSGIPFEQMTRAQRAVFLEQRQREVELWAAQEAELQRQEEEEAERKRQEEEEARRREDTGGKGWCTRLVHCKYTARTWTKYPPYTDLGTGSTFRIFQANFFAVSLVQEIPGTFTVSPVM